jgi:LysW-gamma-L-lysine carboxypeptidase
MRAPRTGPVPAPDEDPDVALLHGLVSTPSLSGEEAAAAQWLVEAMRARGFPRAEVDGAGNAVGELGRRDAPRTVVLLGHIDTVAGEVPCRIEEDGDGRTLLYGRGAVDAKGPLAAFVAAAARLGEDWARERDLRLVVAGAVEEEAATSRGARWLLRRFDGKTEPLPVTCIIGEPSGWHRVTLGYKGRLLVELEARRAMTHTAGPDPGVAVAAVELWQQIDELAQRHNAGIDSPFAQLLPSLRVLDTASDGLEEVVRASCGLRLPVDFDPRTVIDELAAWASRRCDVDGECRGELAAGGSDDPPAESWRFAGGGSELRLDFHSYEPAWLAGRDTHLVRAFVGAIREVGRELDEPLRPGLVSKTGTSDMNVVAPVWRCPILAYGPGDSALDHTPREHLDLDEYRRSIRVLERALDHLAVALRA